jgi:hypothetical protein
VYRWLLYRSDWTARGLAGWLAFVLLVVTSNSGYCAVRCDLAAYDGAGGPPHCTEHDDRDAPAADPAATKHMPNQACHLAAAAVLGAAQQPGVALDALRAEARLIAGHASVSHAPLRKPPRG